MQQRKYIAMNHLSFSSNFYKIIFFETKAPSKKITKSFYFSNENLQLVSYMATL